MSYRISHGLEITGAKVLQFTFDGKPYEGLQGDSVASALLAAGVRLFGRSFKYHRPRGVMSAGEEEANALVTVNYLGRREPNARATEVQLQDGMVVESQNCWPSLKYDIGALNQLAGPILGAGFYYKTFMWPGIKGWMIYERFIRKAAGLGRVGNLADPAKYDSLTLTCDHLIVGGGLAGLLATRAAVARGERVIWADQKTVIPGLMVPGVALDSVPAGDWCAAEFTKLQQAKNLKILEHTSVNGLYDQNVATAVQRKPNDNAFERFIEIEPHAITLATGAIERPIACVNNDLPGVMMAAAAQSYLARYGVAVGRNLVAFTNNDSAYEGCFSFARAGVKIAAIADSRTQVPDDLLAEAQALNIPVHTQSGIGKIYGRSRVKSVVLCSLSGDKSQKIACDGVLMSGGWNPAVHLWSQAAGKLRFEPKLQALIPTGTRQGLNVVGAAAGHFDPAKMFEGLKSNWPEIDLPALQGHRVPYPVGDLFEMPGKGKKFVDFQNDVTTKDIRQAIGEGYQSVEHLKRFTTLGMATDQGKTSNVTALALMAQTLGKSPDEVGTTRFRPPYKPVTIGAFAGYETGTEMFATRLTPLHSWHKANGAKFVESGDWYRATAYPHDGETVREASIREAKHVREHAGIVDVSTLGKILVEGPDALEFLNRIYVNAFTTLKPDRSRYGVMLREDGLVLDDGTVCRLDDNRYLVTTTTGNAGTVFRNFDRHMQVDWPELRVATVSMTDQYCAIALAGPKSRKVLENLLDTDISDGPLPFMAHKTCDWHGHQLELFRVSFSGELAYELFIPARQGVSLWEALLNVGAGENLRPYGLKALDVLRTEKGHLTGAEIDGRRTLSDIGFGAMAKPDRHYVGQVMAARSAYQSKDRLQVVGLKSVDPNASLEEGMHLVSLNYTNGAEVSQGHVTSACFSPMLNGEIGLAVLRNGRVRHGETLIATCPMKSNNVSVAITDPVFFDPRGDRLRG